MILAIDVDNVLCNLQEVVTNLFNERNGTNYTLNDFTSYDVMNVLPIDFHIDFPTTPTKTFTPSLSKSCRQNFPSLSA